MAERSGVAARVPAEAPATLVSTPVRYQSSMVVEHFSLVAGPGADGALAGVQRRRLVGSLGGGALDAELVALRIGQHRPAGAVVLAVVGHQRGADGQQPVDLLVPEQVGDQVEVDPVLHRLALGHGDEQEPGVQAARDRRSAPRGGRARSGRRDHR